MPRRKKSRWVFDPTIPNDYIDFCESFCSLTTGRNTAEPLRLLDYQKEIIREIFGWVDPETGFRKHTFAYIELPKKNAKSYMSALLAICQCIFEPIEGQEIVIASGNLEQSQIVFTDIKSIIRKSKSLSEYFTAYEERIIYHETNSVIKPLTREGATKQGFRVTTLICDEFHVFPEDLWDSLVYSQAAEQNPLTIILTTAGTASEENLGYQMHNSMMAVLDDPYIDESTYVYYRGCSKDEAEQRWKDPKFWKAMNPGLGVTKTLRHLEDACAKAQLNPSMKWRFFRYHLGVWVHDATAYFNMERFRECEDSSITPKSFEGLNVYLGLDLSTSTDLSACTIIAMPKDNEGIDKPMVWSMAWIPGADLDDREKRDHVKYSSYATQGFLNITEGDYIDHDQIIQDICHLVSINSLNVMEIDLDRNLGAKVETSLTNEGFQVVAIPTNWQLSPAIKDIHDHILGQKVLFPANGLFRYCIGNAKAKMDGKENVFLVKGKSFGRIDPVMALVYAWSRAMTGEAQVEEPITYTKGDFL